MGCGRSLHAGPWPNVFVSLLHVVQPSACCPTNITGFGASATIVASGSEEFVIVDNLGTEARVGFEFRDGSAMSLEDVRGLLLNADQFRFLRADGTPREPTEPTTSNAPSFEWELWT